MGRLTEIDAVRRNIAPVLAAMDLEAEQAGETEAFNTTLDALAESHSISLPQIAAVDDLIALRSGRAFKPTERLPRHQPGKTVVQEHRDLLGLADDDGLPSVAVARDA